MYLFTYNGLTPPFFGGGGGVHWGGHFWSKNGQNWGGGKKYLPLNSFVDVPFDVSLQGKTHFLEGNLGVFTLAGRPKWGQNTKKTPKKGSFLTHPGGSNFNMKPSTFLSCQKSVKKVTFLGVFWGSFFSGTAVFCVDFVKKVTF